MQIKKIENLFYIKIFLVIVWVALWASINSLPGELLYMNKSLVAFFNGMRTISAIFLSILTIVFTLYLYLKKKIGKYSVFLIIFFIHFLSQFIGLFFNDDRTIDLNTTYLILYAFGTMCLFHIINNLELNKILIFYNYFIFFILILSVFVVMEGNFNLILKIFENNNFYNFLHPDISINNQAPPRITGFSRTFAVINTFLLIIYMINHSKKFSFLILIFVFFLSCLIWLSQSRGTLICYYTSNLFLIIFLNNFKFFKKIFLILLITLFSILFSHNSLKFFSNEVIENVMLKKIEEINKDKKLSTKKKQIEKKKIEEQLKINLNKSNKIEFSNSRVFREAHTSGRTQLWIKALNSFDKRKLFGYGPQADRIVLMDLRSKYSNNVSNAILYSLLSGGYFSLISIILIYFYFTFLLLKFFIKKKLYNFSYNLNRNNFINVCAIIFCIFFMARSLVENSFSVFSIDFLITFFSLFIFEKLNKNLKIIN